ncbi:MAG: recombinase family protein [bacterium]
MTDIKQLLAEITGQTEIVNPTQNGKVKAYAWARVSTEEQDRRGESMSQQLREIHSFAERSGYEIVEEFSEAASAFSNSEKRIEFNRMINEAKADPDIRAIIVHDMSRFSRDSIKGRELMRDLREIGINVISVSDPNLDPETPAGLYTEAIVAAKNEAYSRDIAFHTRKGCKANMRMRDLETGCCYKNGGMPLWGYKLEHVEHGIDKYGKPILKGIWVLDDTIVAGKPLHEWVRFCLVEMAMKGASLAKLRDFCNETGISCRRDKIWNSTSWKDLLYDFNILKYAGLGIWNVRAPKKSLKKRRRPITEWEIVEDAHPAIITLDEALALIKVRQERRKTYGGPTPGRTRKSTFLLTGGVAVCDRCGKNLIGHKSYYVCGSEPYRGGKGCGEGVYVPQLLLESAVITDIKGIIAKLADPVRFTKKVNAELKRIWETESGHDPNAEKRIKEIDRKITHLREQLENGLDDVGYFNNRIRDLKAERQTLESSISLCDKPLQVDSTKAISCRARLDDVLQHGKPEERKEYVQAWLDKITLFPKTRELEIYYRVPADVTNQPIMNTSSPGTHWPG